MEPTTDDEDRPPSRRQYSADGEEIQLRQASSGTTFEVRMPVATTGEVRNQNDEPLTQRELRGMAQQINERPVPVFPDHGGSAIGGPMVEYALNEKLGEWRDAEVQDGPDAEKELVATAEILDPEEMPAAAGKLREILTAIKRQVAAGFSLSSSIGWRTDDAYAGGVDLMEASIVGVGADPRTTSQAAEASVLSRAAVEAGADPEAFVSQVRAAVADATDTRAEYDVNGQSVTVDPPEAMQNAAQAALDAKQEFDTLSDCGTGVGEDRARQLLNDEVGPEVVDEVAAYLTSHEEDVQGIDQPPTDWSEETWTDGCGPVQYALWGGTATGTGIEWAQDRANAVAEARDEDVPYPNRTAGRNLDDPAFAEGDAVMWSFDGEPVHGRVAGIHEQFTPPGLDDPITGDEGEAVYSIHEWDDDVDAFRRQNVAKPQSSLSESQMDMPPASDENFQSMTDDDTPDDDGGTTAQDGDDPETQRAPGDVGEDDLAEMVAEHYDGLDPDDVLAAFDGADFQGVQLDTLSWFIGDVVDMNATDVEDLMVDLIESADNQEMDDDEDEDDEDEANAQDADGDDLTERLTELEDAVQSLRSGDTEAESPGADEQRDTDTDDDAETRDVDDQDGADDTDETTIDWRA